MLSKAEHALRNTEHMHSNFKFAPQYVLMQEPVSFLLGLAYIVVFIAVVETAPARTSGLQDEDDIYVKQGPDFLLDVDGQPILKVDLVRTMACGMPRQAAAKKARTVRGSSSSAPSRDDGAPGETDEGNEEPGQPKHPYFSREDEEAQDLRRLMNNDTKRKYGANVWHYIGYCTASLSGLRRSS